MKKVSFFLAFTICACSPTSKYVSVSESPSNLDADVYASYPKASPDATHKFMLESNITKTDFYVDGKKIATGKRLFILINPNKSYTMEAKPTGYIRKEAFIQPPFNALSQLSFTYLIEDKANDTNLDLAERSKEIIGNDRANLAENSKESVESINKANDASQPSVISNTNPTNIADNVTQSNNRTALVIGNSAYQFASELTNPANDANDITVALKKLGFNVTTLLNANQKQMDEAIGNFGRKLTNGGVGLFFYAGHGAQVSGENYLIPIDSNMKSEADIKYKAVNAGQLLSEMGSARNGMNIVILDACRNNPFPRSFRALSSGLAEMNAPQGSIVAFATAPGSIASDGKERNGLYTQHILKNIEVPNLPIELMFKKVLQGVNSSSNGEQIPWTSSSFTGDFYFKKSNSEK